MLRRLSAQARRLRSRYRRRKHSAASQHRVRRYDSGAFESLEERVVLAVVGPALLTGGVNETNHFVITSDFEWITISDEVSHQWGYIPGAFNPDFLSSIELSITGDEANHLTTVTFPGPYGPATCLGTVAVAAGNGGPLTCTLTGSGMLVPGPQDVVGAADGDESTSQVDISFSLLDSVTALPGGNAIIPAGPGAVATLAAIPGQISAAYLLKALDGAPPEVANVAIFTALLTGLGIIGAASSAGTFTVEAGNMDDTVDLTAFERDSSVDLGSGNDSITLGTGTDDADGGDGTDTFIHNPGSNGKTKTLDGGAGSDLLVLTGFDQSDVIEINFTSASNFTFTVNGVTNTYNISNIEEIGLDAGGGDDLVTITGLEMFDGAFAIGTGDGIDEITLETMATEFALQRWAEGTLTFFNFDGAQSHEFDAAETLQVIGPNLTTTTFEASDAGNEISVFPEIRDGESYSSLLIDEYAIVRLAATGTLNLNSNGGADVITVDTSDDPTGTGGQMTFETINVNGQLPSGGRFGDGDQLYFQGSNSLMDTIEYSHGDRADRGTIEASDGNVNGTLTVNFEGINAVELIGGEAAGNDALDDLLIVNATPNDDIFEILPSVNSAEQPGQFILKTGNHKHSQVQYDGFERRHFMMAGGDDLVLLDTEDFIGSNTDVEVVGGDGGAGSSTKVDLSAGDGVEPTEFFSEVGNRFGLSIEFPTAHDRVDVTPGEGVELFLHLGEGDGDFVTFHARPNNEILFDMDSTTSSNDGTLGQLDNRITLRQDPMYGSIEMTGISRVNINAGSQVLNVEHGALPDDSGDLLAYRRTDSISDRLELQPTGPTSGIFRFESELQPKVSFHETTEVNFFAQGGTLFYTGTDLIDVVNIVQEFHNTATINQTVGTAAGPGTDFVPVQAIGYDQIFTDLGRQHDFVQLEVFQCVADNSCMAPPMGPDQQSDSNELAFSMFGGNGKDQLAIIDNGPGDTILRREEVNEQSGFVKVGDHPPVDYAEIETLKFYPVDPVAGGSGDGTQEGRVVMLEADPMEPNDNRFTAHEISDLVGVNRNPNIGTPGVDLFGNQIPGDEDWYRYEADTTGTYLFVLFFEEVGDPMNNCELPNGNPGLPDCGELDLLIYDERGNLIVDADTTSVDDTSLPLLDEGIGELQIIGSPLGNAKDIDGNPIAGEQVGRTGKIATVGVEQNTTIYVRIKGATPAVVNEYDLVALSPAEVADGPIADLLRDGIIEAKVQELVAAGTPEADAREQVAADGVSDPPGGGLRINKVEINSFNPADQDRADCMTGAFDAGCRTIFPTDTQETPTFQVESITVFLESFPPRGPGFQYEAIHETIALQLGNYELVGEHTGPIEFADVVVDNGAVELGETAKGTVTLHFNAPLPDDRYTFVVRDTLVDPAIQPLDGETNAIIPVNEDEFKSGNGVPGGDFVGKFTVDTRVEIGTFYAGSYWLDLNQNGIFDPDNPDPLNRDVVYQFGENEELVDKTVIGDWDGDGFDEIGLFALDKSTGTYRFRLDRNSNGIFDPGNDPANDPLAFEFLPNSGPGVEPVVGDWDDDGTDNIGVLSTGQWILDLDDNQVIDYSTELFPTNFSGLPFAGDWDGSGVVRVGSYDMQAGIFRFDIDDDKIFDPNNDLELEYHVPGLERPLVGDFDADFDTNIGLLIADTQTASPGLIAQWLLDLGNPAANPLMELTDAADGNDDFADMGSPGDGIFQPAPTGITGTPLVYQDVFFQVRDARFAPVVGNFDLPLTRPVDPTAMIAPPPPPPPPMGGNPFHNAPRPTDVDDDGMTTPADATEMGMFLGMNGIQPTSALTFSGFFWDVDNDEMVTPQDYLAVVNYLGGGGEGEALTADSNLATAGWFHNDAEPADVNLDGVIAASDARAIANQINANGIQMELDIRFRGNFVDPNGDGYVTGRDFLFVANLINQQLGGSGEGEGEGRGAAPVAGDFQLRVIAQERPAATPASTVGNLDRHVATTGTRLDVAPPLPAANLPTANRVPEAVVDVLDEDEPLDAGLLDLLAEDVGQSWPAG